jgi:hypothetical protein
MTTKQTPAIDDAILTHAARHLARRLAGYDTWGERVEIDVYAVTLDAVSAACPGAEFNAVLRTVDATMAPLVRWLVGLGLLVKDGRGRNAKHLLAKHETPDPRAVAAAVLAEMRAARRVEADAATLALQSPALARMGLFGERAREALRLAARANVGLRLDHLVGAERYLSDAGMSGAAA